MGHARLAPDNVTSAAPATGCPFHSGMKGEFNDWLDKGLQCSAGKREFKLGRYHVARITDGADFAAGLEEFKQEVRAYNKTGYLAIYMHDISSCHLAEDELWRLGKVVRDAGLARSVAELIKGDTVAIPVELRCPVTGEETSYEFFAVAFTQHAADTKDPLYDPSLSAPFTAINTTSDAFAFAMLVRDQSIRAFGKPPHEVRDREAVEHLLRKCVTVWQNMSANTIINYNRLAPDQSRAVHLSEDRRFWIASHNDPVFGELEKLPHAHEMPIVYARRLADKWLATLFDGKAYEPSRDGQSGGIPAFEVEGIPKELYQF